MFGGEASEALSGQVTEEGGGFLRLPWGSDPGNCYVGAEGSRFSTESYLMKMGFCLFVYLLDLGPALVDSYPDHVHSFEVWKGSGSLDLDLEGFKLDLGQGLLHLAEFCGAYVSEELECEVDVLSFNRFEISAESL